MNIELAPRDPLTGAFSRAALQEWLEGEMARASKAGGELAMLAIDLDHFKSINDAFGHQRGDQVLSELGRRLQGSLRLSDLVFRYGGDEFIVALPDTSKPEAMVVAQRVLDCITSEQFGGE